MSKQFDMERLSVALLLDITITILPESDNANHVAAFARGALRASFGQNQTLGVQFFCVDSGVFNYLTGFTLVPDQRAATAMTFHEHQFRVKALFRGMLTIQAGNWWIALTANVSIASVFFHALSLWLESGIVNADPTLR